MERQSFIIKFIIGSILIEMVVVAQYCQLCRNHVACHPKRGFGARCGNKRAIAPLNAAHQNEILQIHDGMRSLLASGFVTGYPPAKRMGHLRWDAELAKIAAINARQCYMHLDKCRKTRKFPHVGQNVGIERAAGHYPATNQSIHSITLKWFRQFSRADATIISRYRVSKNRKKKYLNFATMVHDKQTSVGCAAVKFRYRGYYYFYLVCNYSMRTLPGRKIYEPGTPYTGCVAGRSTEFASLCARNEPIKAVPHPVSKAQDDVSPYVNPLSYFGYESVVKTIQTPPNNKQSSNQTPLNVFQQYLHSFLQALNVRAAVNNPVRQPAKKRNANKTKARLPKTKPKTNRRRNRRSQRKKRKINRKRSGKRGNRRKPTRRSQPKKQSQNPFSFFFG